MLECAEHHPLALQFFLPLLLILLQLFLIPRVLELLQQLCRASDLSLSSHPRDLDVLYPVEVLDRRTGCKIELPLALFEPASVITL